MNLETKVDLGRLSEHTVSHQLGADPSCTWNKFAKLEVMAAF